MKRIHCYQSSLKHAFQTRSLLRSLQAARPAEVARRAALDRAAVTKQHSLRHPLEQRDGVEVSGLFLSWIASVDVMQTAKGAYLEIISSSKDTLKPCGFYRAGDGAAARAPGGARRGSPPAPPRGCRLLLLV